MKKRVKARLPRGFRDIFSNNYKLRQQMIDTIREVYEGYGFMPIETPAVEFVDVLGKYLPDSDKPEPDIFAFRVDDQWLALRYDLTAPLSRIVAMYKDLPKPLRRYQIGPVWRLEKPAPGRYREFYQFDIDIIGTDSMAADAEMCMVLCDSLEALGFKPGMYIVKVSNRKILNDIIEIALRASSPDDRNRQISAWMAAKSESKPSTDTKQIKISPAMEVEYKLDIMRCIDKLDRIGLGGIKQLLAEGREDETGDFKSGCFLTKEQIELIIIFLKLDCSKCENFLTGVSTLVASDQGKDGLNELRKMNEILKTAGYDDDRVIFDTQIVRGLSYYTGPVYEAFLTIETTDEKGNLIQFGSVAGGGRYDDLIQRFTGQKIPATGTSIGIDRLLVAYQNYKKDELITDAPVLVTVMDHHRLADYQKMAHELRQAGIATELYLGNKGISAQIKYADQRQIPIAVIAGENEFKKAEVTLKDLRLGTKLSTEITDREQWRKDQPAQIQVPREKLVEAVKEILGRYRIETKEDFYNELLSTYEMIKSRFPDIKIDSFKVIKDVVKHRNFWKPKKVKTLLLAKSHVYTSDEDHSNIIKYPNLKNFEGLPQNYVRLVYCLGYGENQLAPTVSKNKGTPQYWKIFASCTSDDQNFDFNKILVTRCRDFSQRLNYKVQLLQRLKTKGVWLVDCSIVSLTVEDINRTLKIEKEILKICWKNYISTLVNKENPEYIIVIGKLVGEVVSDDLSKLNIPFCVLNQPQAHLPASEHKKILQKYQEICNKTAL